MVPILALLALTMMLSVLTMKSVRFRALLCGRPSVVVREGVPDQGEMARNRLTVDELLEELRGLGYPDLSAVRYAILETNGRLSVLPFAGERPPTARELGVRARESGLPRVVVSDGRVLEDNLRALGKDRAWLREELGRRGCREPGEVFLLLADEAGQTFLTKKETGKGAERR